MLPYQTFVRAAREMMWQYQQTVRDACARGALRVLADQTKVAKEMGGGGKFVEMLTPLATQK